MQKTERRHKLSILGTKEGLSQEAHTDIKNITREYHKSYYGCKFNTLDEIDQFFVRYKLLNATRMQTWGVKRKKEKEGGGEGRDHSSVSLMNISIELSNKISMILIQLYVTSLMYHYQRRRDSSGVQG